MTNNTADDLEMDWTGHHLMDVGIATICAMAEKSSPKDLTMGDLDDAAKEMEKSYFDSFLTSYFSCVFTMNAYHNPTCGPDKKEAYRKTVLWAHRNPGDLSAADYTCPFSGKPATHFIDRRHMPMLSGENILNFYPGGHGSLPVYGPYLTALQALPMGSRRASGRLFAVYADNPDLLLAIASKYLEDNRRILNLAVKNRLPDKDGAHPDLIREIASYDKARKKPKYCDVKYHNTLLMQDLSDVNTEKTKFISSMTSVTAYWLSNTGQGPSLDLFHFPSGLIKFLKDAKSRVGAEWDSLINKGWHYYEKKHKDETPESTDSQGKSRKKPKPDTAERLIGPGRTGNAVFEDLTDIFIDGFTDIGKAHKFVGKHLLGNINRIFEIAKEGKIRSDESLISWNLTGLFLIEVIGMNKTHIEAIRIFSDKLASYISETNDNKLFRSIIYSQKPWELRNQLTKAQRNVAKEKNNLLFSFQEYLDVFLADEAVGQLDWRLTGDLISIRLMEKLLQLGYFNENPGILSEDTDDSGIQENN